MTKLNQIIAIEKGIKAKSYAEVSELHKINKKAELFNGFDKQYRPRDDNDDEKLPAERKRVQFTVSGMLDRNAKATSELINVTARKDYTNCVAAANVVVDGKTIITNAPVSFLLFMEKQLTDMNTFISELPVLDEGEDWTKDVNSGLFKSRVISTHRTKKISKPIVLYNATPEHPAQTQMVTEDVIAGFWEQVRMSGAMPKPDKEQMQARVVKLLNAVKQAREAANMAEAVGEVDIGNAVFDYILTA
jgi:hypothetical protein